jgi:hypothetical protein
MRKNLKGAVFASGRQAFTRGILRDTEVKVVCRGHEFYNISDFPILSWLNTFFDVPALPKTLDLTDVERIWKTALYQHPMPSDSLISIMATPEWVDREMIDRIDGGVLHEVFHSLYSVRGQLDRETLWKAVSPHYDAEKVPYKEYKKVLFKLNNIFEDAFIEKNGILKYKGALSKIQKVHELVWDRESEARNHRPFGEIFKDSKGNRQKAMDPLVHLSGYIRDILKKEYLSLKVLDEYDAQIRHIVDTEFKDIIEEGRLTESSYDCLGLAFKTLLRLAELEEQQESQGQGGEEQESKKPKKSQGSKTSGTEQEGDTAKDDKQQGRGCQSPEPDKSESSSDDKEEDTSTSPESEDSERSGDPEEGQGGSDEKEDSGKDSELSEDDSGNESDDKEDKEGRDSEENDPDHDPESNTKKDGSGENENKGDGEGEGEDDGESQSDGSLPKLETPSSTGDTTFDSSQECDSYDEDELKELIAELGRSKDIDSLQDISQALQQAWNDTIIGDTPALPTPYSTDEDRIIFVEAKGTPEETEEYNFWVDSVKNDTLYIRPRFLSFFRGQKKTRIAHRQERGRRVSSKSVGEVVYKTNPKPFMEKKDTKAKNSCVTLLIDESQSMSHSLSYARKALLTVALTVGGLKIPLEIVGFTTGNVDCYRNNTSPHKQPIGAVSRQYSRTTNVEYRIFRKFDEPFNVNSFKKINQTSARGATPLPDAIEFAAKGLSLRKEEQKILFVITDGYPYLGDLTSLTQQEYLVMMENQIKEYKKLGIETMFIGIGYASFVENYPNSVFIRDMGTFANDLSNFVFEQMTRILSGK